MFLAHPELETFYFGGVTNIQINYGINLLTFKMVSLIHSLTRNPTSALMLMVMMVTLEEMLVHGSAKVRPIKDSDGLQRNGQSLLPNGSNLDLAICMEVSKIQLHPLFHMAKV